MTALIVGTVLALGALAYVLAPLIAADGGAPRAPSRPIPPTTDEEEGGAVAELREIEFDHATGKLSDGDYAALKARYTADAAAEAQTSGVADDAVEAEIRRARALTRLCPTCGPRPEPGARYCSSCGAALA
ncbi:MAG: hypothetical protein ACT4PJ_07315 [Gemmatimonadaceae bacterium]